MTISYIPMGTVQNRERRKVEGSGIGKATVEGAGTLPGPKALHDPNELKRIRLTNARKLVQKLLDEIDEELNANRT